MSWVRKFIGRRALPRLAAPIPVGACDVLSSWTDGRPKY